MPPALHMVPPPPPQPTTPVQLCLGFVRATIVVHGPRPRRRKVVCRAPGPTHAEQFPLRWEPRKPPRRSKALRTFVPRVTGPLVGDRPREMRDVRIAALTKESRAGTADDMAELVDAGFYVADADGELQWGPAMPVTFGECPPGPCPLVSCRHHNYLEVDEDTGAIKINFPDLDPLDIPETCSLRKSGATPPPGVNDMQQGRVWPLEAVGLMLNLTRVRVFQLEGQASERLYADPVLRAAMGLGEREDESER